MWTLAFSLAPTSLAAAMDRGGATDHPWTLFELLSAILAPG
jgi:hypothetical protein